MNKKLMASILLASMAAAYPAYADDDRTPDEYNPDAKYESPLDQPLPRIVNDYRDAGADGDCFSAEAGKLVQGSASGKEEGRTASGTDGRAAGTGNRVFAGETQDLSAAVSPEEKAKQQAEVLAESRAKAAAAEQLLQTDENFEPELAVEYPGYEYQARKYAADFQSPDGVHGKAAVTDNRGLARMLAQPAAGDSAAGTGGEKEAPDGVFDRWAENDKKAKGNLPGTSASPAKLPLILTGEEAHYSSESGDFLIEGNVHIQQGKTNIYSTRAVGNAHTGDVWLLEGGTLREPMNTTHANWGHYNFNTKTGELRHIDGKGEKDFFKAPHAVIEDGMMIIDKGGSTTRCEAVEHDPCLEVKAKTITIIPNERIIARGVQVFVKGKHIYSRDVWINELAAGVQKTMPRIGWKDKKGFYVSLDLEQPIGNPLLKNPTTAYMHQVYYTKSKYKPFYGIRHDEPDFYLRLNHGYVYDSDDDTLDEGIWLHKKMDWGLFLKPHRIAPGVPLSYDANVTHGLWKYTNRRWSSWHTEKVVHLRHDRIYPIGDKKLYLDLMVGRKWVDESNYRNRGYSKGLNSNIYEGTLGYRFSDKWNIWTRYHDEHKTSYNFSLGQPDFAKEWRTGISWKPDDRNTLTVVHRHNSDSGSRTHGRYSTTYSWMHRFCCEALTVSYQKKHYSGKHEWTVKFDFINW